MTTFRDAIELATDNDIEGFKNSVNDLLMAKVGAAINAYRPEYAATMFSDEEPVIEEPVEEPDEVEVVSELETQEIENEDI